MSMGSRRFDARSQREGGCSGTRFAVIGDRSRGNAQEEVPLMCRTGNHYGKGRWRKMKGSARIRLRNGDVRLAEIHWYEAHRI